MYEFTAAAPQQERTHPPIPVMLGITRGIDNNAPMVDDDVDETGGWEFEGYVRVTCVVVRIMSSRLLIGLKSQSSFLNLSSCEQTTSRAQTGKQQEKGLKHVFPSSSYKALSNMLYEPSKV
jgi:hypothetical protein